MKWQDTEKKARTLKIKHPDRYSKADLIKAIQKTEGNFDCFGTALSYCDRFSCCWRSDCLTEVG